MLDRLILYCLIALAFASFAAVFYLIVSVDDTFTIIVTLVPLAMWLAFYLLRSLLAARTPVPSNADTKADGIVITVLGALALLTLGAMAYLPIYIRMPLPPRTSALLLPLGLSLAFYLLVRSVLA